MTEKQADRQSAIRLRGGRTSLSLSGLLLARRAARGIWQFAAGGTGANQLPPAVRRNLRWFWLDGLFANASDSVVVTYLPVFLLALGGTPAQIGLMNSLASLSAALFLLPSAALVERWGHRKQITVFTGGGAGRLMLLMMALAPLLFSGQAAIYAVISLVVARSILGNMGLPAWTSLTADIVPLSWRGRYFSSRNIALSAAGLLTTFLAGQLITRIGEPAGHQLAIGSAFVIGLASTFSFYRIQEPPMPTAAQEAAQEAAHKKEHRGQKLFLRHLRAHPEFLIFCATAALWSFSVNVAAPFFSPYLVETLRATPDVIGILSIIAMLTALPGQRLFGRLTDRWGPRRVQLITGLLIPLLPLGWALTRSPWHVVPIHVAGGFIWAGYNLANFNLLLALTPEDLRPRYTALYQIVVTTAFAAGAAIGSVAIEMVGSAFSQAWGYHAVFILSGIGRLAGALLFASQRRRFDRRLGATDSAHDCARD
jgi:MFS family permease